MNHPIEYRGKTKHVTVDGEKVTMGQRVKCYGKNSDPNSPPELESGTIVNWLTGNSLTRKKEGGVVRLDKGGYHYFKFSFWQAGVYPIANIS